MTGTVAPGEQVVKDSRPVFSGGNEEFYDFLAKTSSRLLTFGGHMYRLRERRQQFSRFSQDFDPCPPVSSPNWRSVSACSWPLEIPISRLPAGPACPPGPSPGLLPQAAAN